MCMRRTRKLWRTKPDCLMLSDVKGILTRSVSPRRFETHPECMLYDVSRIVEPCAVRVGTGIRITTVGPPADTVAPEIIAMSCRGRSRLIVKTASATFICTRISTRSTAHPAQFREPSNIAKTARIAHPGGRVRWIPIPIPHPAPHSPSSPPSSSSPSPLSK